MSSTRPKILTTYPCPIHQPPFGEARMLRDISKLLIHRDHDVSLLSMGQEDKHIVDEDYKETVIKWPAVPEVASDKSNYGQFVDRMMGQFRAQRTAYNAEPELRKQLRELQPDIILTSNFFLPQAIDLLDVLVEYKNEKNGTPKLIVLSDEFRAVPIFFDMMRTNLVKEHGSVSFAEKASYSDREAQQVRFAGSIYTKMVGNADAVVFYTDQELNIARNRYDGNANARLVRIQPPIDIKRGHVTARYELEKAVFFGNSASNIPNANAKEAIIQQIAPKVRGVTFIVAGQGGQDYKKGNVESIGRVADISGLVASADVYIVPLEGGTGIQTKLIDAIRLGIPIISTSSGAEGFPAINGVHMIIEDDISKFAGRIGELKDMGIRRRMASAAKDKFSKYFSGATVGRIWEELFSDLTSAARK